MQVEVLKLKFLAPLHIGRGLENDFSKSEIIFKSDALKSALYALGINYYNEWLEQPDLFFNSFAISSCFPFIYNKFFFPKPLLNIRYVFDINDADNLRKKIKKIEFVSSDIFEDILNDKEVIISKENISDDGLFLFKSNEKPENAFATEVQQRVAVPLEWEKESKPYYIDRVYFRENCGLFFLIQYMDETIKEKVINMLNILGNTGIGADRNVGNGQFDVISNNQTINLPDKKESNKYLNLGLYLPTEDELNNINIDESKWQLIKRGGYISASSEEDFIKLRKKSVFMFNEGAIFKADTPLKGRYIDCKPKYNDERLHSVWRCGAPLFIKI
jgi:CRISPR-associated protein Csm4